MIKTPLSRREAQLRAGSLSTKELAEQKAEAVFLQAESIADQRGYVDANKWAHICGALHSSLKESYEVNHELSKRNRANKGIISSLWS